MKATRSMRQTIYRSPSTQQSKLKGMLANQLYRSIKVFNFPEMNIERAVVKDSTRNYIVCGSEVSVCLDKRDLWLSTSCSKVERR